MMAEPTTPEIRVQAINGLGEFEDVASVKGRASPAAGLSLSNKLIRSLSGNPTESRKGSSTSGTTAIDPITQNIMERKSVESPRPQKLAGQLSSVAASSEGIAESTTTGSPVRQSFDRRPDESPSASVVKEKKPKVSFLSRLRTGARKRDSMDLSVQGDDPTDDVTGGLRSEGAEAAVFSQPMGYIPKFPEPPKYIKVRARGKTPREFDHLFLAQELRGRTGVEIAQAGGHKINVQTKMKHDNASWAMEFSKDGHYLAAGGHGHVVRVWAVIASEADRREEERCEEGAAAAGQGVKLSAPVFKSRPVQEYEGHTASILSVSWSKNNFLLSSSMDKTVRLWHVSREECLCVFKHPDYVPAVQFHPQDDRFFLAGSLDSKLRLWSIPDKNVAYSTLVSDLITAVAFTPDGKTIMAGTLSGLCIFYDTEKLKEQTKMHVRSAHGKNARGSKITGIEAVNFPPNDPKGPVKLLITSNDSRIRVYNMRDKSLELKLKGNENATSQIRATFSDDAKHIICGSEDKKCYIWDVCRPDKDREKHPMETFDAHNEIVTSAIMAPAATKQLLQSSGDPVFEICNPPPVQLLSKEETKSLRSLKSSAAASQDGGGEAGGGGARADGHNSRMPEAQSPVEPPSAFKSRSNHPGGDIIITADTEGRIKCFRSDCAYKNRAKNIESWDTGPTFGQKVLQRTSSVATRASRNSASFRDSIMSIGAGAGGSHPVSERIQSWRHSVDRSSLPPGGIAGLHSAGGPGGGGADMARSPSLRLGRSNRSASPRKSISGLGTLTQGRRLSSLASLGGIKTNVGGSDSNGLGIVGGAPSSATANNHHHHQQHPLSTSVTNTPVLRSAATSDQSLASALSDQEREHSQQYSRKASTRSALTSEFSALSMGEEGSTNGTVRRSAPRPRIGYGAATDDSGEFTGGEEDTGDELDEGGRHRENDDDEEEEERCRSCGGQNFRAVRRGKGGGKRLECAKCGLAAD